MNTASRIGIAAVSLLLGLTPPARGREVEMHIGAHVFSDATPAYEALFQVNCPAERPAKVGLGGQLENAASGEFDVTVNGSAAGTVRVDDSAPVHWLQASLPAGEARVKLQARGVGSGVLLRATVIRVVLLDDAGCTVQAACPDLAEVSIQCAGMEPFVCELLRLESDIYCKQLQLDRAALRYQDYPDPTIDIWTPEDRELYNQLAPQLEVLTSRQQQLYARLEELSRKQPRQLKAYLDVHRQLELRYQRALAASR